MSQEQLDLNRASTQRFKARMGEMIIEAEERAAIAVAQAEYFQQALQQAQVEIDNLRSQVRPAESPDG